MNRNAVKTVMICILLVISVNLCLAADPGDEYKPYLHKATVPESPKVKMFGQYKTSLFPGAATYVYNLEVPKGTNELAPSLSLTYNSQTVKQKPGVVGAGWALTQNIIYRNANSTLNDTSDDELNLILNGASYEFVYDNGSYHTKVESYMKIENLSGASNENGIYWVITSKDGTRYRFGYNSDSELASNAGYNYSLRWSLDQIEDNHGNNVFYEYLENPYINETGVVYLDNIIYNNDRTRKVELEYENQSRPDARIVYEQGNKVYETRKLESISVYANDNLVRAYNLNYTPLGPALTAIGSIKEYGPDSLSLLHDIRFEYYNSSSGYDRDNLTYVPERLFTEQTSKDYGVRLIDFNNDGYVDYVEASTSLNEKRAYINNRVDGWNRTNLSIVPEFIVGPDGVDQGIRFADVNNDGFVDILQGYSNGSIKKAWINNKTGWNESSIWAPPVFLVENNIDQGTQLIDFNGDGKIDILRAYNNERNAWINNGSGWTDVSSIWRSPVDLGYNTNNGRARVLDLNGDGLPDIIEGYELTGQGKSKNAWINNGSGWTNATEFAPPVFFTIDFKPDPGYRFVDINGDGLPDLLEGYKEGAVDSLKAWLNNGTGWVFDNSSSPPTAFVKDTHNIGRRIADVNGDGLADIVVAYENSSYGERFTYIRNSSTAYLLKRITNEYGGVIDIDYSASTAYNNTIDDISGIGFNLWVVSNFTKNNSLTGDFSSAGSYSYKYAGGIYNYNESEFRGFNIVNETKPDGNLIVHYFHQNDALKGKEYETDTYNSSGSLYSSEINEYNYTYSNYYNVYLRESSSLLYDGNEVPRVTSVSYSYDNYGNVISKTSYGEYNVSGDEKHERYSYVYNLNNWIVGKVSEYELYSDDNSTLVKKTEYAYDNLGFGTAPINGDVTWVKEWSSNGDDAITRFEYDNHGNVIAKIDPLGHKMKYIYGLKDVTYTYPERVENTLRYRTDYSYDLGTGNLLWEEKENIRKRYSYDIHGRILKEILPYDTTEMPTKSYSYTFDSVAPEVIKVSLRENAGDTVDTYYYYDGFANLVQLKTEIEESNAVIKNIFYDSEGRVIAEQNPYFELFSSSLSTPNSTISKTFYYYDALDRVVKVINPDSTEKKVVFDRWTISDYDENSNRHDYLLDAYGRITTVVEHNVEPFAWNRSETYNTSYSYDSADNLVKIVDDKGNEFKFSYDSLGRKIKLDDPDLGVWNYSYDAAGNLIEQRDNIGNEIIMKYDDLNRVVSKNSSDVNISFRYDGQYEGTLSNITMFSGSSNITYRYTYDDRMRVVKEEVLLGGIWIETGISYDSMDRIIEKKLVPEELEYYYNKQGKIKEINYYLASSSFNAFGSITERKYGAYVTNSTYDYNSENNRITQIKTGNLQQLDYTYDNVGNVNSIIDSVNNYNYSMGYDGLDRLINTTINNDIYQYEYDSIGNVKRIVRGDSAKRLIYGDLPHAPSSVVDGESGAGAYYAADVDTGNKNRTIEFFLVKEKAGDYNDVNWSVDFDDGNTASSSKQINLSAPIMVLVQHDYSNAGSYELNISTAEDTNLFKDKFGLYAKSLDLLANNRSLAYIEFVIDKDIAENATNVQWSCSNGVSSSSPFSVVGNAIVLIEHNYSSPGDKEIVCNAGSDDGSGNKTSSFKIKGLEIEQYEIFDNLTNKKTVMFNLTNYFHPLAGTVRVLSDLNDVLFDFDLNSSQSAAFSAELNYTTDGDKTINVTAVSGSVIDEYNDYLALKALEIERYQRLNLYNDTSRIIMFDVWNYWPSNLSVNWSIAEPVLFNNTNLSYNKSVMVIIEENYTTEGEKKPLPIVSAQGFTSSLVDKFNIYLLEMLDLQILRGYQYSTITEIIAKSNTGNRPMSWSLDTGEEQVSSEIPFSLNASSTMILVEHDYDMFGIYTLNASINSTDSSHNKTGVISIPS